MTAVGLLHPGAMGAAIGHQLVAAGHQVLWCPTGRSLATARRATAAGLTPVDDLAELLGEAELVLSICPPAHAECLAHAASTYAGTWVEANAITPDRARRIASLLPASVVVDGGIVGSPPVGGKRPMLYLSGPAGAEVLEELFADTDINTRILGERIGQASALKLSYSAYQKASRVLAAVSYGLAQHHDVDQELLVIAGKRPGSYLLEINYIPKTAARAWRWGPELIEAADMLRGAGLPDDMLRAAAAVLARWEQAKDDGRISVDQALEQLRRRPTR
jgi:3-hydroxyisobutyrate dehydrogenase-like beta-hydroxyacid dehydrogenase